MAGRVLYGSNRGRLGLQRSTESVSLQAAGNVQEHALVIETKVGQII
jgi:hypothetical protein